MAGFEKLGDGDWRGVTAAVGHCGLVLAVRAGALGIVGPDDGGWTPLGDRRWSSRLLFSAGEHLLSIEEDGALLGVDPAGGALALPGDWSATSAATGHGGFFWACSGGKLWRSEPATGAWQKLDSTDVWRSRLLLALGERLYSLEEDGVLYALEAATGAWRAFQGDWSGCTAAAVAAGRLWLLASGLWYEVDPGDGRWRELDGTRWRTRLAVAAPDGRGLLCFEEDGGLYKLLF